MIYFRHRRRRRFLAITTKKLPLPNWSTKRGSGYCCWVRYFMNTSCHNHESNHSPMVMTFNLYPCPSNHQHLRFGKNPVRFVLFAPTPVEEHQIWHRTISFTLDLAQLSPAPPHTTRRRSNQFSPIITEPSPPTNFPRNPKPR